MTTMLLALQMKQTGITPAMVAESFELAQLAEASLVGSNIAQMAARFAGKDDDLARLVREQQDLGRKLADAESARVEALSQVAGQRDAAKEAALEKQIESDRAELARRDAEIASRYPEYQELTSRAPVSTTDAQALLGPDEAIVVYMNVKRSAYAWVVRHERVDFVELPTTGPDVRSQVQFVRSKLQPDDAGKLPEITPATSNALYRSIFAPIEASLRGATRVFLVPPVGPLQTIPFAVLGDDQDHWLATRYAFSVLPSVSSLRALRRFGRGERAQVAFVGFGDPLLEGKSGAQRDISTAQVFTERSAEGLADVDSLRKAPRLPETADELRSLSAALGGSSKDLFLGERATETAVKTTDLSRYRLVAFATHGITAGELSGAREPGLVLTPPAKPSQNDDGYLSSSEVADLRLNADWVLLSACNTAAADGSPGAEGLSGLARAFFYSGSRALLVSNWPVASEAAKELVSATVRNFANAPAAGKAEALRLAMVSTMANPKFAHPFFWAPFSEVGD
jgi:CHAT domain-containing protein